MNTQEPRKDKQQEEKDFPGYPIYPANEDIYSRFKEEEDIDPEDVSKLKTENEKGKFEKRNEKDFGRDKSGDDLDIPGGELDDEDEILGEEDEENNYYSLGGDNHENLDEDNGD
ncbi:hypothetical protein [Parasediminibacterium sp. JCM 36343]|uniref:hypothetical protein n=1 Tax=Parasediminibacterium sp. JCM 36343 TaxID=3374279 RepID=UPI00397A7575